MDYISEFIKRQLVDEDHILDIIEHYEHGCGCVYCPKSAVPNRSPDKEVCTPADCARALAEYYRRMEG